MSQLEPVYIVSAKRTPVGKRNGVFKHIRPDDLLAHTLKAVMADCPGLDPKEVGDVVAGCAMPEAEQGLNVARMAVLLAGLPVDVPALTINRYCSSGLNAVSMAAERIACGAIDVAIGAGTESMSVMTQMMGNKIAFNPAFFAHDELRSTAFGMGATAERVATQYHINRADQDEFALRSHQKALSAINAGHFNDEIAPYTVRVQVPDLKSGKIVTHEKVISQDEGPRADASIEGLGKLKTVFNVRGSVTAGNSSQMSDGAGAVLLMSEKALKKYNAKPIGRYWSFSVAGVPPEIMGIGPIAAIPKALASAGLTLSDLAHIELNEAFAAQALAVIRAVGLDPDRVNPYGGAIALGHPLGATGAIRTATLIHALRRNKQKYGMVTMCIGTGMGAAGIFEAL